MAKKKATEVSTKLQDYLACIAAYEREFKKWEQRSDRILKRYRDEDRPSNKTALARFNILWSNVQTLVPAVFSRLPQPDVSRRFRDNDPVGRVAALILERSLDFEIQHYTDYRSSLKQTVYDRFLNGRGTVWARYEPHFKQIEAAEGVQVTEDAPEAPVDEQLDYECAPLDYVHWKDFGHDVARTWEEVTKVWRWVYMSEDAVTERFGEEIAAKIPYDASPEELKRSGAYDKSGEAGVKKQAKICELWNKTSGTACWFSKGVPEPLDEREDPLRLQEFFPCPRPLYATVTNDSLIPVPDFSLYQDQAKALDVLADRIDGLCHMLQLKGVYDGSADSSLGRLFTEGKNGDLLPVKNWAQFAEKGGLKGQVDVYDLTPLVQALNVALEAFAQQKEQVYEITGISDIIRGQTQASETATAQQIKGQYASLRLRSMQDEVAQFATDCLRLKAQIICSKFDPHTIAAIAAVEQLTPEDQQHVYKMTPGTPAGVDPMTGQPTPPTPPQPEMDAEGKPIPLGPAMLLLIGQERAMDPEAESPNPLRSFRIDVAADTLVQIDEQREKQDRMEMLTAFGTFLDKAAQVGAVAPQMVPLMVEVGKFGLTAFKVGKQIEGTFDAALDALKKSGPPPDPKQMQEQAMQQAEAQVAQKNATKEIEYAKKDADLQVREMLFKAEQDVSKQQRQAEDAVRAQNENMAREGIENEKKKAVQEVEMRDQKSAADEKIRGERAKFDEERSKAATEDRDRQERETADRTQGLGALVKEVQKQNAETQQALAQLVKAIAAPKRILRGPDGRAQGVEAVS